MNILGYIRKFGKKSFVEYPFNHIDALIMSELSYMNFDVVLNKDNEEEGIILKDTPVDKITDISKGELTSLQNSAMLKAMLKSIRYKELVIKWPVRNSSIEAEKQFFAITIKLPNGAHYIAYRGTDLTLLGWKEDFNMSFISEVPAQKDALEYLIKITKKFDGPFYIGGHSKGGNLSFFAALKMPEELSNRLITAYSFDGPGFGDLSIFDLDFYKKIKERMVKIVPSESLIGILLGKYDLKLDIVESTYFSIFQHNPFSWKISSDGSFDFVEKRTHTSYVVEKTMDDWINSMSIEEIKLTANSLFLMLGDDISKTLDKLILEFPITVKNFIKGQKKLSKEEKKTLSKNLNMLFEFHSQARHYYKKRRKDEVKCIENK